MAFSMLIYGSTFFHADMQVQHLGQKLLDFVTDENQIFKCLYLYFHIGKFANNAAMPLYILNCVQSFFVQPGSS